MDDGPLVVCLCAAWCTACNGYRNDFDAIAREYPDVRFAWVDIEDHSDVLGDAALDIETFPTLLILSARHPVHLAPVLPGPGATRRLVDALQAGRLHPLHGNAQAHALADAVSTVVATRD